MAFFAGAYGSLLGQLPSSVLTGLAGVYALVGLTVTTLLNEPRHTQLLSLVNAAPKAVEAMSRALSKRKVLQIEKLGRAALSNPRFARSDEERILYEELSKVGLAHPGVKFGKLQGICGEQDAPVVVQQLRSIASYVAQGGAAFAASRTGEERKALEEAYPAKKASIAALTFG